MLLAFAISIPVLVAATPAETDAKADVVTTSKLLKGFVCDKLTQETLAGAIITVNGQKVYSDLDGNFALSTDADGKCKIEVSFISYKTQSVEVDTNTASNLQINLQQQY